MFNIVAQRVRLWCQRCDKVQHFNKLALTLATKYPRIKTIDFAKTVNFKSLDNERLGGDSNEHYGNIIRLVELQVLMFNTA